jgi:hypothetical protein
MTLFYFFYHKAKILFFRIFFFKKERNLLKGKFHSTSNKQSVAYVTINKAASTFLAKRFNAFFQKNGYTIAYLTAYLSRIRRIDQFHQNEALQKKAFAQKGVFYGAFRYPISLIPDLKIILVVRDPRDVLVSLYYSNRYSHGVNSFEFYKKRKLAATKSIDEYALLRSSIFLSRYTTYLKWLDQPNVLLLRYEDLIVDPVGFEEMLGKFLGITITPGEIASPADFVKKKEDIYSHKRQVKSGNYREKLKPETIAKLNSDFDIVLKRLNYAID